MKAFFIILVALATLLAVVTASNPLDTLFLSSRHTRLGRRRPALISKRITKRCPNRSRKKNALPTSASNAHAETSNSSSGGLLNVQSKSHCGPIGATREITETSGPNGSLEWLNCGIHDNGWTPPYVRISDLVTKSLSAAIKSNNTPFKACAEFVPLFDKYGGLYGVPAILLASFAMQESSCNPDTVGGAGEQGLMQLTKDKCGGAPNGNCKDPNYNIETGAKFFAETLKSNNGDVLLSIGSYNGWFGSMTFRQATAAASTSCCRCQNNLDYLHQFLNGWCQNIDAYDRRPRLGKYFNLDKC